MPTGSEAIGEAGAPPPMRARANTIIIRIFIASVGLLWAVSGGITILRSGSRIPDENGILFRPAVRYSDIADPLIALATGSPFSGFVNEAGIVYPYGINYPPGSIPILRALLPFTPSAGNLIVVMTFGIALALLMRFVAFRVRPFVGAASAIATLPAVFAGFSLVDYYPIALVVAGTAALAVAAADAPQIRKWAPAAVGPISAFSFPAVFAIDRMNIDLAVFAISAVGLALVANRRNTGGSFLLGAAIAAKFYPYAFIVAFHRAPPTEWLRRLVAMTAGALAITVGGFALIQQPPLEALRGLSRALAWVEDVYAIGDAGMGYGASLFTGLKAAWLQTGHPHDAPIIAELYHSWAIIWLPTTLFVIAAVSLLRIPTWSRLAVTTSIVLLASPITGGYRVIFELIPLAFWIAWLVESRTTRCRASFLWQCATAVAFAAILTPKTFWTIALPDVTSETLLAPVAIGALAVAATGAGLRSRAREAR